MLFVWEKTVRSGMCMGGAPVICVGDAISCLSVCLPATFVSLALSVYGALSVLLRRGFVGSVLWR